MGQDIMLYLGAISLGALHAFEPGHGKTLIAAYLIGTRGRTIDGILLGAITTFTHTFSVIILGIIARLLSHSYSEQELHAWLGLASSLLILGVGLWMLRQRLGGHHGHQHFHLFGGHHHHHDDHDHHQHHHHHDDHRHRHHHHAHNSDDTGEGKAGSATTTARYSKWNLLLLGISGGLIPCPAAIATLLAAIGAGRVAQGLTLALFFSLGLGLVMMTIGVVLAHAGKYTEQIGANQEFSRRMGIASAFIITILGGYTLYHSLQSILG